MKKVAQYLYYRCYDFLYIFQSYDIYFATLHLLSMIISTAILLIIFYSNIISDTTAREYNYAFALAYLISLILFYFITFKKKKYLEIISEFEKENKLQKVIGRVTVVLLIVGLVIGLFNSHHQ